jgi:SPP1 family predicted phage head-tail adaptor
MSISAGRLRHRIDIEQKSYNQDSSGDMIASWAALYENVPSSIEPLSAREFLAAQNTQSQVVARVTIRYRAGLNATMRINHNGTIYNPAGFLSDKISGLEYLTIPVTAGTNEG